MDDTIAMLSRENQDLREALRDAQKVNAKQAEFLRDAGILLSRKDAEIINLKRELDIQEVITEDRGHLAHEYLRRVINLERNERFQEEVISDLNQKIAMLKEELCALKS